MTEYPVGVVIEEGESAMFGDRVWRATQRLGDGKMATIRVLTYDLIQNVDHRFLAALVEHLKQNLIDDLSPWLRPDRKGWPLFTPYPRLAKWQERAHKARRRVRDLFSYRKDTRR